MGEQEGCGWTAQFLVSSQASGHPAEVQPSEDHPEADRHEGVLVVGQKAVA